MECFKSVQPVSEAQSISESYEQVVNNLIFESNVLTSNESIVSLPFRDQWKTISAECFSAQGEFVLMMSTSDSRNFLVITPVVLNYPVLHTAYTALCDAGKSRFKRVPLRTMAYLETYLSKVSFVSPVHMLTWLLDLEDLSVENVKTTLKGIQFDYIEDTFHHCRMVDDYIHLQSGEVSSRNKSRLRRELIQRENAYAKAEELRKREPKAKRKAKIKKARDRKQQTFRLDDDFVCEQGFGSLYGGVTTMFNGVMNTASRVFSIPSMALSTLENVSKISTNVATATDTVDMGDMLNSVKTTAAVAGVTAMKIGHYTEAVAEQASVIGIAATQASDVFTSTIKKLQDDLTDKLPRVYVKCLLSAFLVFLYTKFTSKFARLAILGTVLLVLGQVVYDIFFKNFRLEAISGDHIQMQSDTPSLLSEVFSAVMVYTALGEERPVGFKALVDKITNTASKVPRTIKGIDAMIETVVNLVEKCVNIIRVQCELKPIRLMRRHADDIEDLIIRILEFEHSMKASTTGMTEPQQYNHILHLSNTLLIFKKVTGAEDRLSRELNYMMDKLGRMAEPLKHSVGVAGGARPQPASLLISGSPGLGKTMMVNNLSLLVMKLTGNIAKGVSAEEASRSIYVKPANSPYMDGYNHQFTMLYDDFLQMKTTPGQEGTEVSDLMTHYGPFTSTLNMADCPKKGMYPFTSKLILMTTNVRTLSQIHLDAMMVEPLALVRRIDHHVRVQVRKEFRVSQTANNADKLHQLDYAKFAAEEARMPPGINKFPWHVWEYRYTHFGDEEDFIPGTGYDMRILINDIAGKITANQQYHENAMDTYRSLVDGDVNDWSAPERVPVGDLPTVRLPGVSTSGSLLGVHYNDLDSQPLTESREALEFYTSLAEIREDSVVLQSGESADTFSERMVREHRARMANRPSTVSDTLRYIDKMMEGSVSVPDTTGEHHNIRYPPPVMEIDFEERQTLIDRFRAAFDFDWSKVLKPFLLTLGGVVALTAAGYALKCAYHCIRDFMGYPNDDVCLQQSNAKTVKMVRSFRDDIVKTQSGNEIHGLWYKVYQNTFKLTVKISHDKVRVCGQLLLLADNTFVMPHHFLRDIQESLRVGESQLDTEIHLRSCAMHDHTLSMTISDFLGLEWLIEADRDLAFSNLRGAIQPRANIIKFIMKSDYIKDQGTKTVRLDTARVSKDGVLIDFNERVSYISPNLEVASGVTKYIGEPGKGVDHKLWLRYLAETTSGDCGAVLSVTDHSRTSCQIVIGLHIGRSNVTGHAYATQLDQEIALKALNHFGSRQVREQTFEEVANESGWKAKDIVCEPTDTIPFTKEGQDTFGSFRPYCTVSKGTVAPVSSSLVPTIFGKEAYFAEQIKELSGGIEPATLEVMNLGGGAMVRALEPFSTDTRFVNPEKFRDAVFTAMQPFSKASEHFTARTFSFEEAVVGVPALGFASIPRSTSLGYPWCLGGRDKSYFFGKGQEYDLSTDRAKELRIEVMGLSDLIREGTRPLFVCRDFLKDEVRKKGKSARLIAGTDVRYYILCRMYFGAFMAAMTSLHQSSGVCLGVNQYSEWSWLKEFVTKKGPKVWDGDFAGFDSSQQPQMLWEILHFINAWYTRHGESSDNSIREILFLDLVHSRHLVADRGPAFTVVEWMKSLPSGHFLTAIVNSILSMSLIVAAYMGTTGRMDFWEKAGVAAQGDDNLVNASDEVIHQFNQVTCSEFLQKEFGMVYTAGRKGEELKPYMGIEDVIFLQRRFATKEGVTVCPIRPESFLHSLYFVKKQKEKHIVRQELVKGLENALEELALYPESAWRSITPRISEAFKLLDEVPALDITNSRSYFRAVRNRVPAY